MSIKKYALCGGGIGLTLSVLAFFMAGGGHGSYIPAWLFFAPLVLIGWHVVFFGGVPLYIAYGILTGWANRRNKGLSILLILVFFHSGAAALSFWVSPDVWDYEFLERSARIAPLGNVLALVPFILTLLVSVYAASKTRDIQDGVPRCRRCSYNLTGNTSGICPECGEEVPHELGETPPGK